MSLTGDTGPALRHPAKPGEEGQSAVDGLVRLLDLEQLELDLFRGKSPQLTMQRVFGGQVAGQALIAAGRTVAEDRNVHSLHSYFLRPGDPEVPIIYQVDRVRDGRSFTTRHVEGIQHGKVIFTLSAQFQLQEKAVFEHGDPMPDVPDPESLPRFKELMAPYAGTFKPPQVDLPRPIDMRYVSTPPFARTGPGEPYNTIWIKADGKLPDDRLMHICALTYASDMTLLDSAMSPHGVSWARGEVVGASLDHAMWFHRAFRADEWILYRSTSPSASGNRGFCTGQLWSQDGRLIASAVQEGVVRSTKKD
ncbi:acyl-CoA thioesterase-2 [Antricoccus suffuscus]|uniref:Acyl-CoA thioesterase 2 n=1 Tax=Antricoccus suffuscus TaxID=1629062 RepID=A0A2T0Z5U4_9ACTN|nr:acyl-CoA thioesterase II [Antricoccus suffuscus]PRZ31706.1 acyl-CoA thioesterase-2 [Antricoccus suffuscus]